MSPPPAIPDDTVEFPEQAAATLQGKASALDDVLAFIDAVSPAPPAPGGSRAAIDLMLELVRKLLGDWTVARHLGLAWAAASNGPLEIKTALEEQQNMVAGYWDGPACDAFSAYLEDIYERVTVTSDKMIEIGDKVTETICFVYDTYAQAVQLVTDCAAAVVNLSAATDPAALSNALSGVVEKAGEHVAAAISTMGDYEENLTRIEITTVTFPPLPAQKDTVDFISDSDGWEVSPAP